MNSGVVRKKLEKKNGRYHVDIGISVAEWREMLLDGSVFDRDSLDMILRWYTQEDHQATSKTIMNLYCPEKNGTPYNGIVKGLSVRILKHLNNRFWVERADEDGKQCYWCIPFEGWHIDYDESKNFVWKLRPELVEAIDECYSELIRELAQSISQKIDAPSDDIDDPLESIIVANTKEGKKKAYFTTKYERNSKNRDAAIRVWQKKNNGCLCCEVCGFDFEKVYGERGKGFIEVHHNKPLYEQDGEVEINPEKDLSCICSNCHRMIHRNKSEVLSVKELRKRLLR